MYSTSSSRTQEANRFWQPNSLVIRRAKLNNGLWGKCVCSSLCLFDETGRAMLGCRTLWPSYPGPSISIRQPDRHSLFCHGPFALGHRCPHVYFITRHYLVNAWRHHLRRQRGKRESKGFGITKKKKKILFLLRFFLSRFPEVITELPMLYWGK